ncbi:hypothetical protein K227x_50850 [Rubripirellula lacrimiformis]|uniref:Uncharacterized protein n=1 Tax=Rubripirellula lacrimiformis TaxID=1930273 RepID=A0A517NHQ6_9BACT|nr:hypothetical protein [Rubripirellula lacrimiformis]QDT06669.1 hypothetical protein K227x_50850 [Rubripirellula lacrimiformis]
MSTAIDLADQQSVSAPSPRQHEKHAPRDVPRAAPKKANALKILSIVCSIGMLVWTFASVLSGGVTSKPVEIETAAPIDPVTQVTHQQSNSSAFYSAAVALDAEFMRNLRTGQEDYDSAVMPGIEQSRQHWEQYRNHIQREIDALAEAPVGSLEWQYREQLIANSSDGPL